MRREREREREKKRERESSFVKERGFFSEEKKNEMSLLYNLSTLFPSLEQRPHQRETRRSARDKKTRMVKNPKVDHTQTDSMNLKVLRRDDPSIQAILGSASSITMYELDMSTTKWHRKNVEGSLFVVERKVGKGTSTSNSRFQFVVLNRLSDERFVESIAKDAEFELSEKYLLYKTDSDEVNGVWFYDEKEQTNIYEIIQRAQEMERSGVYTNNEDGVGKSSSSIDDVASLFQSAMGVGNAPAKSKPKKPDGGKKKSGGGGNGEAAITRDAIRKAMLRLATNDAFLDAIASELGQ